MKRRAACAAALTTLALAGSAPAQIVNVQPLIAQPDRRGLVGAAEGSLDWRTGNTDLTLVSGSVLSSYRVPDHLFFGLARADFGVASGESLANRSLVHLRWRWERLARLQPEVFVQHDRDEKRRLALRALFGVGPRVPILTGQPIELALGLSYFLELERVKDGGADAQTVDGRVSTYLTLRLGVNDTLKVAQTLYVQPRASRPSDVRVLSETEVVARLGAHVALKVTPQLAYDADPPPDTRGLDTTLKTGVQVSF